MHGEKECCLIYFSGSEKIHRNNFRVSLPRCRAVRVRICSFDDLGGVLFGANGGSRPSMDGLAFPTKMKTFWVIKYLNIYSTNK